MSVLQLGSRRIGDGERCFIIAEAGVNHDGDLGRALELIDAAADAGADAVKFQTFRAAELATAEAPKAEYQLQCGPAGESQRAMLERLELDEAAHRELFQRAAERAIVFLSSPFDFDSAAMLVEVGVAMLKIGSGELTHLPLLLRLGSLGVPVALSTGMSDLAEVEAAVAALRQGGCTHLALLHCVSCYPADPAEANLRAMATLAETFGLPVGFSDHTPGIAVALAARAMGACIIEKHLTLDRHLPGPDHHASLEPQAFAELVAGVRQVEAAMGDGIKRPTAGERHTRRVVRRSLVTARALEAGTVIDSTMLEALRPAGGISPSRLEQVIGRCARRALPAGHALSWEDLA